MLVKAPAGRRVDIVIQAAEIGQPELADTDIDVLHTRSVSGHIQIEVIVLIDVEPIIESLATPEGNFWSTLKHVRHFEVRFAHHEIEVAPVLAATSKPGDECGTILDIAD